MKNSFFAPLALATTLTLGGCGSPQTPQKTDTLDTDVIGVTITGVQTSETTGATSEDEGQIQATKQKAVEAILADIVGPGVAYAGAKYHGSSTSLLRLSTVDVAKPLKDDCITAIQTTLRPLLTKPDAVILGGTGSLDSIADFELTSGAILDQVAAGVMNLSTCAGQVQVERDSHGPSRYSTLELALTQGSDTTQFQSRVLAALRGAGYGDVKMTIEGREINEKDAPVMYPLQTEASCNPGDKKGE